MGKNQEKTALITGVALNLIYYFPVLATAFTHLGRFDGDQHFFYVEIVRRSLFDYGQIPFWDPWHMGGMELMGNPQAPFSPLYFPVLLFGTMAGTKFSVILLSIIGFWGMYRLAREVGLDFLPALAAAMVWDFNGVNSSHMQGGWFMFSHLHLFPVAVWAFLRWKDDLRYAVPFSLLIGVMVLGGSPYPMPILYLLLGTMGLYYLFRKEWRPLAFTALSLPLALMVAAFKVIPSVFWIHSHPRDLASVVDGYSLTAFLNSILRPHVGVAYPTPYLFEGTWLKGVKMYAAVEYAFYLGPLAAALILLGLFQPFRYKWPLVVGGLVTLLVMFGEYSPLPVWDLLRKFPIYDNMRVVARYKYAFLVPASLLCGAGLAWLTVRIKGGAPFRGIMAGLLFAMFLFNGLPLVYDSFPVPFEKIKVENPYPDDRYFQRQTVSSYYEEGWLPTVNVHGIMNMFPYLLENIGVVIGYEPIPMQVYATGRGGEGYIAEAFLHDGKEFTRAAFRRWGPSRMTVRWDGGVDGMLYLNQNYQPGWHTCGDGRPVQDMGIVGVRVRPEDREITFCYTSPYGYGSIFLSLLTIGAGAWYSRRLFRERREGTA